MPGFGDSGRYHHPLTDTVCVRGGKPPLMETKDEQTVVEVGPEQGEVEVWDRVDTEDFKGHLAEQLKTTREQMSGLLTYHNSLIAFLSEVEMIEGRGDIARVYLSNGKARVESERKKKAGFYPKGE